jgi:hypothetical protein
LNLCDKCGICTGTPMIELSYARLMREGIWS